MVEDHTGRQVWEHKTLTDKHGQPLRYSRFASPYPNRKTRRAAGMRLPLNMVLQAQQLFAEEAELMQELEDSED